MSDLRARFATQLLGEACLWTYRGRENLAMTSRLALHMVEALPLRSVWVGRKSTLLGRLDLPCERYGETAPYKRYPLVHWWMKGALLVLASAVLVVAVVKILRAAL
jgi:hypothetical protein